MHAPPCSDSPTAPPPSAPSRHAALRRRTRRRVAAAIATVTVLAACSGTNPSGQTLSGRSGKRDASREFVNGTVAANNTFAADLYRAVAGTPGNFAYGSHAVFTSLAMARVGSAGTSRQQFDAVLHAALTPNLDEGLNAVGQRLDEASGEKRSETRTGRIALERAIGLWTQRGTHVKADLLDALAADFGAGFHTTDFRADAEGSRRAVNSWAAEDTETMITELVPRGGVSQYTLLLAASGEALRAPWQVPFEGAKTAPDQFFRDGDTPVDARMMEVTSDALRRAEGEGWSAVELPYLGDELALDVIVPDGPLAELEAKLSAELLRDITGRLDRAERQPLDVRLPQFTFTTTTNLQDPLRRMGLAAPQGREADFPGISSDELLSLSGIPHQSVFGIDEEGTLPHADTATAETATPPLAGAARVTIDRPFAFVVRDRRTDLVVVVGRVTNPG